MNFTYYEAVLIFEELLGNNTEIDKEISEMNGRACIYRILRIPYQGVPLKCKTAS